MRARLAQRDVLGRVVGHLAEPARVEEAQHRRARPGTHTGLELRVHGWKPLPISARELPVSARTMEVLPACAAPSSQSTGVGCFARPPRAPPRPGPGHHRRAKGLLELA
jgi:hypothetical protein